VSKQRRSSALKYTPPAGLPGGILFFIFFMLCGNVNHFKKYYTTVQRHGIENVRTLPGWNAFNASVLTDVYMSYFGFVAVVAGAISQKSNAMLFAITVVCESRGLSHMGIDFLASLGFACHQKTFRRRRDEVLSEYDDNVEDMLNWSSNWSLFLDNFAQPGYKRMATIERGVSRHAQHTGVALLVGPPDANLRLTMTNQGGKVVPCWPRDLTDPSLVDMVKQKFAFLRNPKWWEEYYDMNFYCKAMDIHNYPPKDAESEVGIAFFFFCTRSTPS
jgi:hypothetical protein